MLVLRLEVITAPRLTGGDLQCGFTSGFFLLSYAADLLEMNEIRAEMYNQRGRLKSQFSSLVALRRVSQHASLTIAYYL